MTDTAKNLVNRYDDLISTLQAGFIPLLLLFCRLWVAWVFFNSGLIKISSWDSTLYLFELEYQVPILPWELAAYLGTAAELVLPRIDYPPDGCDSVCVQHHRCSLLPIAVGERFL